MERLSEQFDLAGDAAYFRLFLANILRARWCGLKVGLELLGIQSGDLASGSGANVHQWRAVLLGRLLFGKRFHGTVVADQHSVGLVLFVYFMQGFLEGGILRVAGDHHPVRFVQVKIQGLQEIRHGAAGFFHAIGKQFERSLGAGTVLFALGDLVEFEQRQ